MSKQDSETYYDKGQVPSLDAQGGRVGIIPAEVQGLWRRRKTIFQFFLLLLLLIGPWTQCQNSQTILLDIPHRKFTFFGVTLWAHEAPLVFLVLILSALGLFFVTSVWGRVWCGWACPQTVFIELVYRRLEVWIEGNYLARRKMQTEEWTAKTYLKKTLKWLSFFLVSSLIAHSLAAYFIGAKELLRMMGDLPTHNLTYFVMISFITGCLLFNFGWFREQFCVIMCPYGRFQSALLDANSQVVFYDSARGEPRRGKVSPTPEVAGAKAGDCVACGRCVQVCPTGIDIRIGLQMECIACTACMDACDTIMDKVGKPKGLIRYGTQSGEKISIWRPRSLVYLGLFLIFFTILGVQLATRKDVDIGLLRAREIPFQIVQDDQGRKVVLNHFVLHVKNQTHQPIPILLSLDLSKSESLPGNLTLTTQQNPVTLPAGEDRVIHFFIKYVEPWDFVQGQKKLTLLVNDSAKDLVILGKSDE